MPGIITALATLLTAVGGFIVVLNQVGFFGTKSEPKKEEAKGAGIVREQQVENLGSTEVKQRQAALEAKIKQMEAQLERQRQHDAAAELRPPSGSQSAAKPKQPFSDLAQIAGTWYDPNGAYYSITQAGTHVALQEFSNVYGVPTVTAAGQGSVIGETAIFNVTTIFNTTGTARVQLSDDKNMLIGEYKDNVAGTTTYLRLSRSPLDIE